MKKSDFETEFYAMIITGIARAEEADTPWDTAFWEGYVFAARKFLAKTKAHQTPSKKKTNSPPRDWIDDTPTDMFGGLNYKPEKKEN